MSYDNTWGAQEAFDRYQAVRHRMPDAQFPSHRLNCTGLLDIADEFDAFLLDGFGVLNVGETPIPGANSCLDELRRQGKRLILLTNAASYTRDTAEKRYHKLGFDFAPDEIVSSRDVAVSRLGGIIPGARWGAVAAPDDTFCDIDEQVKHWTGQDVDGFLLLSSATFGPDTMNMLHAALQEQARPVVVANPDLVAPRETGLSKEPGYYAHKLADQLELSPAFYGKPFGNAFVDAMARLSDISPRRIAMVGDTLHTDILGGAAAGLRTVLVRDHGLFAGLATKEFIDESGIRPDFSCASI